MNYLSYCFSLILCFCFMAYAQESEQEQQALFEVGEVKESFVYGFMSEADASGLDAFPEAESLQTSFGQTLRSFLDDVYIGHSFVREAFELTPALQAYLTDEIPLKRLDAPGAMTYLFDQEGHPDFGGRFGYSDWHLENIPVLDWPNVPVINKPAPLQECDETESQDGSEDGIYYSPVSGRELSFQYLDPAQALNNSGALVPSYYTLPAAFADKPVMKVEVVRDNHLQGKLYFIHTEAGWKLFLINDEMACSA